VTSRPGPLLRRLLALPAGLYRAGAGWLLGHRFLLLTHRGRRSGRLYETVLEVVRWRSGSEEAVVMSGFGPRSQWYRNVLAGGAVEIQISRRRLRPSARVLPAEEAVAVLADYERRNRLIVPVVRRVLSRLAGFRYDGSEESRRRLVETLPLVEFVPEHRDPG
jgi:deazaflavin-dependent oxidoreductase (nitroreductase family)